jgi:hypothetical protein
MIIEVQFLFFYKKTFSWALVLQHHQAQCHAFYSLFMFSTSLSILKKKPWNVSQLVGICYYILLLCLFFKNLSNFPRKYESMSIIKNNKKGLLLGTFNLGG